MRGAAGHPADNDRDVGFKRALAEYPEHQRRPRRLQTSWDQTTATHQINEILAAGTDFDGVWTSGIDNVIVDALSRPASRSCRSSAPTTPASSTSSSPSRASQGAAVTNPGSGRRRRRHAGAEILNSDKPGSADVHP